MMTDQRADQALSMCGHPSAIEQIAADYLAYGIHREHDGACHGHWVATREDVTLTAKTPSALLVALESQELSRLQAAYGDRYVIRRTPSMWIATRRKDDNTEPTIIRDTSEELEAAMDNPGTWGQRPLGAHRSR